MGRTPIGLLALVAGAVFTAILLLMQAVPAARIGLGNTTWLEWLAYFALAVLVLRLGLAVRAYLKGNKPNLDPIRAARTLALAKAAQWTGAVLFGRYLAAVVVMAQDWGYGIGRYLTIQLGISALSALTLLVVGIIVEHFCELPPSESDAEKMKAKQYPQETPA